MFDWFQGAQIGKQRFEIVVAHLRIKRPGHGGIQGTRSDPSFMYRTQEKVFIVVRNARRIGRDVGARYGTRWPFQDKAAGKIEPRDWLPSLLRRMTIGANSHFCPVGAARNRRRLIRLRYGSRQRLGGGFVEELQGEGNL